MNRVAQSSLVGRMCRNEKQAAQAWLCLMIISFQYLLQRELLVRLNWNQKVFSQALVLIDVWQSHCFQQQLVGLKDCIGFQPAGFLYSPTYLFSQQMFEMIMATISQHSCHTPGFQYFISQSTYDKIATQSVDVWAAQNDSNMENLTSATLHILGMSFPQGARLWPAG